MDVPTFVEGFHDPAAIAKMKYRKIGNTDIIASHIGIGGCSAGDEYGEEPEQRSIDTIIEAVRSGINYVDTSPGYGDGKSETVIGKALRQLPRKSFYIATKVGRFGNSWLDMFDFSYQRTLDSVDTSLKRLGVDYIDLIQVHDLEFAQDINQVLTETLPALQEVVKQGKARYIGITGYPVSLLKHVIEQSTVPINTVLSYARHTLQNQDLLQYIPFFQSKGLGIINASITAMSLLTPSEPPEWHPGQQVVKDMGKEAYKMCKSKGVELARLAVQFATSNPEINVNILGCNDVRILKLNIDAATSTQTKEEKQLSQQVMKMFSSLEHKAWEGVEVAEYKAALAKDKQ